MTRPANSSCTPLPSTTSEEHTLFLLYFAWQVNSSLLTSTPTMSLLFPYMYDIEQILFLLSLLLLLTPKTPTPPPNGFRHSNTSTQPPTMHIHHSTLMAPKVTPTVTALYGVILSLSWLGSLLRCLHSQQNCMSLHRPPLPPQTPSSWFFRPLHGFAQRHPGSPNPQQTFTPPIILYSWTPFCPTSSICHSRMGAWSHGYPWQHKSRLF